MAKRKMNPLLKKAAETCRMETKPFTKAFGKCVSSKYKAMKSGKKSKK